MRFGLLFATAILALVPTPSFAKDLEVETGPAPAWARTSDLLPVPEDQRGILFLRRQNMEMHLDKDGQSTFLSSWVRILQSNALELGNVAISWNPAAGSPVVHAIRVHRDGAIRDVLKESSFEVLRREDLLEQSVLSGILTAVLRVPDLRVGDELEISYTVRQQDPTLGADSYGILFLVQSPPPGRVLMRLSWEDGQKPLYQLSPDLEPLAQQDTHSIQFGGDMMGPLNPPKDAPPRYLWQRLTEFSDFATWQSVSARFAPIFAKAAEISPQSPVKQEAARIAAAHDNAKDRAAAALALVQQQVRYIFIGLNDGNLTPASAEQTWERRYGDCKAKTVLLIALLNELGIEAEPVLVNNSGGDDGLDARLPNPGMFDHVLVRAQIDGKAYWLDGTLPKVAVPSPDPVIPYRWVLPVEMEGKGLEKLAWHPASVPDNVVLYEIDARAGFDQPAKIETTTIQHGIEGLANYYNYSSVTEDQLENAFKQQIEGSPGWNTVDHVSWRYDIDSQASVLTIVGTGPVDWEEYGKNSRSLSLPGGGFSPPDRRQRGNDQDQSAPFYNKPGFSCHVTSVRLPEKTASKDWSYNTTFDDEMYGETYRRIFERRDGTIRMIRSLRTTQQEVSPAIAARDNRVLADFDNSKANIYYDPGSADNIRAKQSVPATFEIDWVKDATACASMDD